MSLMSSSPSYVLNNYFPIGRHLSTTTFTSRFIDLDGGFLFGKLVLSSWLKTLLWEKHDFLGGQNFLLLLLPESHFHMSKMMLSSHLLATNRLCAAAKEKCSVLQPLNQQPVRSTAGDKMCFLVTRYIPVQRVKSPHYRPDQSFKK